MLFHTPVGILSTLLLLGNAESALEEDHYHQTGDDLQDALEWEMLVQK